MDEKVRELLNWVQDRAGAAADAAAGTARAAGRRAGQLADAAKLNVQLYDLNGERDGVLRDLGRVVYGAHRGQSFDRERVSALLARADELDRRAEELKARIDGLRQSRACPACGGSCGRDDQFCRRCGAALERSGL